MATRLPFAHFTTAILFLLPGAIAPVYAQGREQEKQPEQKQQQQDKPAQKQQQVKPAAQAQHFQKQQQAKPAAQQQQASRAQPATGHGRIPDARFRASFGSGHTFHVNRSEFAGGARRFQYGGFWFALVDPGCGVALY
jgi:hemolysin activation/secretion protein